MVSTCEVPVNRVGRFSVRYNDLPQSASLRWLTYKSMIG